MERAAFLVEGTGAQLACMLNPNQLVFRRAAGLVPRRSLGGALAAAGLQDDPILFTGGGSTELIVDLLFDVTIEGSSIQTEDVRDLTAPLWRLAESGTFEGGYGRPPLVRFVWGKAWNFPSVVAEVAERLEDFLPTGVPRRSWLRMRLVRAAEPAAAPPPTPESSPLATALPGGAPTETSLAALDGLPTHVVLGDGSDDGDDGGGGGERLDAIAAALLGDPSQWRAIAAASGIDDPLRVPAGTVLRLPAAAAGASTGAA